MMTPVPLSFTSIACEEETCDCDSTSSRSVEVGTMVRTSLFLLLGILEGISEGTSDGASDGTSEGQSDPSRVGDTRLTTGRDG